MDPSTPRGNHGQRIHGSATNPCQRCVRDEYRASGWVRVQQELLRGWTLDRIPGYSARPPGTRHTVPHESDNLSLKILVHRAESATSARIALEKTGPAVSIPQHRADLIAALHREAEAWSRVKDVAEVASHHV